MSNKRDRERDIPTETTNEQPPGDLAPDGTIAKPLEDPSVGAPEKTRFELNREKFRAAFIRNHGWEVDSPLTNDQKQEIEQHPYWTDEAKLEAAVNPPAPEQPQPTA